MNKQDMTVAQLQDYNAAKVVSGAIGQVPFIGEPMLGIIDKVCAPPLHLPGVNLESPATCQAVKDTIGELDAPAFPNVSRDAQRVPIR